LELENQQMEERLRQFRESMAKQRATRRYTALMSFKGESTWSSGQASKGSLGTYAKDVLARKKKGFQGIQKEGKWY
jgi:hypothetical protein